jgi:hypothetical protein
VTEEVLRLDALVTHAARLARPLPSLIPHDAAAERARLVSCLTRGEMPVPRWTTPRVRVDSAAYRAIDEARERAAHVEVGELYLARLEELELDLAILDAWGETRRVRALAARRYGRGDELVETGDGPKSLIALAHELLESLEQAPAEERVLPPLSGPGEPSVGKMIHEAARATGLDVDVRVEPRLASLAATGERTIFLAARSFSLREARRLVAHEVFGHLVAAANGRAQNLCLLSVGLAGSFADQEGVALYLEEQLGVLCSARLRTLAARVLATQLLHMGASFGETAQTLHRERGFGAEAAIAIAERTHRGGGAARDAGYLAGFVRVRACLTKGRGTLDELRMGRVSVESLPRLRELVRCGFVRPARYRPSLSFSRRLTLGGTSPDTSPPSDAASLTMLELT